MMSFRCSTAVDIKRDTKLLERILDNSMIAVANILWSDTLLLCTDSNWHTMLIATANEDYVLFLQTKIAHVDISWHINTSQMTNVNTTICIRQSSGHSGTLKFLFFH